MAGTSPGRQRETPRRHPGRMRYNRGMCGRFTQRFSWRELHALLDLAGPAANLRPRYNVAPGQTVAAVRADGGVRRLAMLRWGLIPSWAKDARIAYKLINARSETAGEKPSFRAAMRARRCLIPADGFYEWTRRGTVRQPWLIAREDGAPFVFAGLWERWTVPRGAVLTGSLAELRPGEAIETCTVLTAAANQALAPLHHRMPVILAPDSFDPWLRGEAVPLGPAPSDGIVFHPVSTLVNKPANDDPRCIEPAAPP
ncbi:MAG: SOS response-associated peptidase [Defluviicoccus sp.]|nr:SOS response-associated peptidase [Defluviicoccus sp.]